MREAIEFLQEGGWPMIPLAICSVSGLAVVLERFVALRRSRSIPQAIVGLIDLYQGEDSVESAIQTCRHSHSSLARIVEEMILARKQGYTHLVESLNAIGRREVERLERGLIVLEIVAGISPLIGLLGTVVGMVTVFDAISAEGLGNAQVLSGGISKALITTITGLSIGIPALAFHSYFSKCVESIAIEMQELTTSFASKLNVAHSKE
ncbi:MAG: MotA/TolQ/ExbB proton channel family protein [Candidatus Hydrogenedentes bacterium]|nr:MotA/TolQ/ExbB proton channel family protein [Candidatus Hydrogenedentota bacterium]